MAVIDTRDTAAARAGPEAETLASIGDMNSRYRTLGLC